MNDLYDDLRHDEAAADPATTRRVVDRWLHERAARRRRRFVLATLGPMSAAAVLLLSFVLVQHRADARRHEQRVAAGRAFSQIVSHANVAAAIQPQRIDEAIDATTHLFSTNTLLALLAPDGSVGITDQPEATP